MITPNRHARRSALGAASLLATGVVLAGCHIPKVPDVSSDAPANPSAAQGTAAMPADPPGPGQYAEALRKLAALTVSPEQNVNYDRENWPHWTDRNGCSTRERILRNTGAYIPASGVGDESARVDDDCEPYDPGDPALDGGHNQWHSFYDNKTVTDASDLDIDHKVPLEEMARSGGAHWSEDQREHYANDLYVLAPVTAHSNRSKGSDDPAEWQPPNPRDVCPYDRDWVYIKARYNGRYEDVPVTVDQAEHDALKHVLTGCLKRAKAAQKGDTQ